MVVRAQWYRDKPPGPAGHRPGAAHAPRHHLGLRRQPHRRHHEALGLLLPHLSAGLAGAAIAGLRQRALRPQRHRGAAQRRAHAASPPTWACSPGWTACWGARRSPASVKLTLVPAVQRVAQQALSGQTGAVVALDPKTGALIASASAPSYDAATLDSDWRAAQQAIRRAPAEQGHAGPLPARLVLQGGHRHRGAGLGHGDAHLALHRHRHLRRGRRQGHQLRRRGVRPQRLHPGSDLEHQHHLRQGGRSPGPAGSWWPTCRRLGFYEVPPLPLPAGEVGGQRPLRQARPAARLGAHGPARRGLGGVRPGAGAGHAAADGPGGCRRGRRRRQS